MTNLAKLPPMGLKAEKQPKPAPKRMRAKSAKRAAYERSHEGQDGLDHMGHVKDLPCSACGRPAPSEAHHCRDMPPEHMRWIFDRLPAAGMKSGARDCIPLCPSCHRNGPNSFHGARDNFHRLYGADYLYILPTRALVAALTPKDT